MLRKNSFVDFIDYCKQVLPASHSQLFQDLWAWWESGFSLEGYFVEFGALNGKDVSNTYLLEQIGWKGIVAEPHPNYGKLLHENRSCHISTKCVYDKTGETVKFKAVLGKPALSSIADIGTNDIHETQGLRQRYDEVLVETISLEDLLIEANAPKIIDFLSIDTEGSEPLILEAFDFSSYLINCICVEHNGTSRDRLFALLTANGYERKWTTLSGHDDWYLRKGAYPEQLHIGLHERFQKISHLRVEKNLEKKYALLAQIASSSEEETESPMKNESNALALSTCNRINELNGTIVQTVIDEKQLCFFVANRSDAIQSCHFQGKFYESEELTLIKKYVLENSSILEIGANIGNHVLFYDKFLSPKEIIVIEPNPVAINLLQINLLLNCCEKVNQRYLGIGLSDQPSKAQVNNRGKNNLGGARLLIDEDGDIPVEVGDKLFWKKDIDFIKIDVEGLEMEVLKGLDLTIKRSRPLIFIEVFDTHIDQFKQWLDDQDYYVIDRYKRYRLNEDYMIAPREHHLFFSGAIATLNH